MADPVEFDWLEEGAGTPVLFVPGSFSSARAWSSVWAALPAGMRRIATALPGCGATPDTRRPGDAGMAHEVAHLGRVARQVGAPLHLVAHSFGATVALAAVAAGAVAPLSLTLFEANPVGILPPDHPMRSACRSLAEDFGHRIDAGDPDAAETIIDYYGGPGTWQGFPAPVREWCAGVADANRLDWETVMTFDPTGMAPACPVRLVRGDCTVALIVELSRRLAAALPGSSEWIVEGAGHFLIHSHPGACAAEIVAAVDRAGPASGRG